MDKVSLDEKFAMFSERFRPKTVAELNGQEVRLTKILGEFPWHSHEREDELFLVWRGELRVEFRDRAVTLGPGELIVVPHGVEHRTVATDEAEVLMFEPGTVVNTGDADASAFTAPRGARI